MVLLVQTVATDDPQLLAIAHSIRQRVFLDEYGLDPALDTEPTDADETTLHFVGFDTELKQHVAVTRSVLLPNARVVQLGRIAVLPAVRGRGHGLAIMRFVVQYLRSWDVVQLEKMFLLCPLDKIAFYEKCGFTNAHKIEAVRDLELHEMVQYV